VKYRAAAANYYHFSAPKNNRGINLLAYFDGFPAPADVHRY
jgi:hypothetical protein